MGLTRLQLSSNFAAALQKAAATANLEHVPTKPEIETALKQMYDLDLRSPMDFRMPMVSINHNRESKVH